MGKARAPGIDEDGLCGRDRPKGLLDFDPSQDTGDPTLPLALSTDLLGLPPSLLTASRETLLLYIAIILGGASPIGVQKRRARGRPAAEPTEDMKRAWFLWWYVRQAHENGAPHVGSMTVAKLIQEVRSLPGGKKLFRNNTSQERLISSVSTGKRKLGIDNKWQSETCAKLLPFIEIEERI